MGQGAHSVPAVPFAYNTSQPEHPVGRHIAETRDDPQQPTL